MIQVGLGSAGRVELADREHDLADVVAQLVAVRVDVEEVVVLAHGLELVERVAERAVVPQAGVQERVLVLLDRSLGQWRLAAVVADVPAVEVEREPRHRDVVADVRRLERLLVRLDRETWTTSG